MDITYLGEKSFKLSGREVNLLTFPIARNKADIVIGSASLVSDDPKQIDGPGEYEVKGVSVFAYTFGYFVEMDGVRVFLAPELPEELGDEEISKVGEIDILLVWAGEKADMFIRKLGPSVIVPFGPGTQEFIEKTGVTPETLPKLSVKANTFLPDTSRTVILT